MFNYLELVKTNKVTDFSKWALICARGTEALSSIRDLPLEADLPATIDLVPDFASAIEQQKEIVAKFESMSSEDALNQATEERDSAIASLAAFIEANRTVRARIEKMLAQVTAWQPPTSEHEKLKTFMIEELQRDPSVKKRTETYEQMLEEMRDRVISGEQWRLEKLKTACEWLVSLTRQKAAAREYSRKSTAWLQALRESLKTET